MIPVLSVNYNTPDLIFNMVKSFRQFYNNNILIVDGSAQSLYNEMLELLKGFENIEIHHFDFNIHHGPGLTYGIKYLTDKQVLILDSDVEVINKGLLEDLKKNLPKDSYGIGDCQRVLTVETDNCKIEEEGFNVGSRKGAHGLKESEITIGGVRYLHPACMLINREIALQFDMPIKHGAPMISTMKHIHREGKSNLLIHSEWVYNDYRNDNKIFIKHPWCGTVSRTGGYNLED